MDKEKAKLRAKKYRDTHRQQLSSHHKKLREANKDKYRKYSKLMYQKRKTRISVETTKGRPDFSPNQQLNRVNLPSTEKNRIIATLIAAQPNARKDNKTSKRKGVFFNTARNKWEGYLNVKGVRFKKRFDTEDEAIEYRESLENMYYTDEQLKIRDKYKRVS